nr:MAG TPA: hypothetical protein [Caudoviricetes sp.]
MNIFDEFLDDVNLYVLPYWSTPLLLSSIAY